MLICSTLLLLLVVILLCKTDIRRMFRSTFSGLETVIVKDCKFKVLPGYEDKVGAAELLYDVDADIKTLINHMNSKYTPDVLKSMPESKRKIYEQIVRRLRNTYSRDALEETLPNTPKIDVSYNLNKGEVLALCLRDYKTYNFHKKNDILFVTLHEIAHSLNCDESSFQCGDESYGHTTIFWFIFKVLLENATECGIYTKYNYKANPINYCSMPITYSPLYDPTLQDGEYFSNKTS